MKDSSFYSNKAPLVTVSTCVLFWHCFVTCVALNCLSGVVQDFFKGLFSVVRRIITVVLHCNLVLSVAVGFSRLQEGFLSKFLWMGKLCHARGSDL